jgi:uncharacterized paraquat-inducible protein A
VARLDGLEACHKNGSAKPNRCGERTDREERNTNERDRRIRAAALLLVPAVFVPAMLVANAIDGPRWYSIWSGIREFYRSGEYFLAGLIFCFSLIFPGRTLDLAASSREQRDLLVSGFEPMMTPSFRADTTSSLVASSPW